MIDFLQALVLAYPLTFFLMSVLLLLTYLLVGQAKYLIQLGVSFCSISVGVTLQIIHVPSQDALNGTLSGLFFLVFSYSLAQGIVLLEGKTLDPILSCSIFIIAFIARCISSLMPHIDEYYFISVFSVYTALVIFLSNALWKVKHLILGDALEKMWYIVISIWLGSLIIRLGYVSYSPDMLRMLLWKTGKISYSFEEFSVLQHLFYTMALLFSILTILVAIKRLIFDISRKTRLDGLTGAYNRIGLQYLIEFELPKTKTMGLIMLDIDFFKSVNTRYGHPVGDAVIKEVVLLINRNLASVNPHTVRLGGEEFLIILPHLTMQRLPELAENLRCFIEKHDFIHIADGLSITVSMGIGEYESTLAFKDIYKEIDQKLASAKKSGRNQVVESI
ncbi:GGDEF domain-containing protein [Acinetobacter sp. B5B]|uniref:GGDEF domain-containing protein n=1 Tax=Acinetobacter baretiae TaxID=2605383 RepID=UPI0018C265CB|nr:GGDEF domain-containing protein [Acinetobacter baretiae]MBF7683241.1 GGDEF domain-containing protein [Acinetobacter baretiae]MBF7684392.1 GGDEF domain-containing protein [Acinetobacter baretiae]